MATYRCQTPGKSADWVSPDVCVPRNANARDYRRLRSLRQIPAFCTPKRSPCILRLRPVQTAIARNRNLGVAVRVHISR